MKEELKKSLTDLIDETLLELEELKKSRYAAAEVKIEGPGEGIAGKPTNGDLHAKAEDKKHEDAESKEEEDKEEKEEAEEAEKAEGKLEEATKAECAKKEDEEKKEEKDEDEKDEDKKDFNFKKKDAPELKKSEVELETLMKSYVDERVKPLEDRLSTILDVVNKIAGQPVAPKGMTARAVPLMKSNEEPTEMLSKSDIASKLFDLKKSGTKVDSLDITRAEMGHDLQKIVDKYKIS